MADSRAPQKTDEFCAFCNDYKGFRVYHCKICRMYPRLIKIP